MIFHVISHFSVFVDILRYCESESLFFEDISVKTIPMHFAYVWVLENKHLYSRNQGSWELTQFPNSKVCFNDTTAPCVLCQALANSVFFISLIFNIFFKWVSLIHLVVKLILHISSSSVTHALLGSALYTSHLVHSLS